jgi:hypothetical protein
MLDWLYGIAGPDYARALLLTLLALALLVVVLVVVKLIRSMTFGTFVAGGRNRKTRLAVMDATPVDSQRRLVLIRRDDTEHLLLIGGPTDLVVERDIRLVAPRRPVMTGDAGHQPPPVQKPQHNPPRHTPPPQPAIAPQAQAKPHEPAPMPSAASKLQPIPVRAPPPVAYASNPRPTPAQVQKEPARNDTDDAFMEDLDFSLDDLAAEQPSMPTAKTPPSLDDEMTKLLGELSNHKK